jgi:hypothetical protein
MYHGHCYVSPRSHSRKPLARSHLAGGYITIEHNSHHCEFCDSVFQDNSTLSKHLRREHSHHFEDAVFAYFDLAVEISEENFQIGADFIKADVFGLQQFEVLLDPELSVSVFYSTKLNINLPYIFKNIVSH